MSGLSGLIVSVSGLTDGQDLVLFHGTDDDNVHYQHAELLIDQQESTKSIDLFRICEKLAPCLLRRNSGNKVLL